VRHRPRAAAGNGMTGAPDPTQIIRLTTAYWDAQTLLTANRMRVFDQFEAGPKGSDEVATALALEPRATRLFLNALTGLGLLECIDGRYRCTASARVFLTSSSPAQMGNALRYADHLYEPWGRLEQSLRSGKPAVPAASYLGDDPARTQAFVRGMHDRAVAIGRALVELVDLRGRSRLLDVGGGPGTYSVMFTARTPGLTARVLELPGVAAVARGLVAEAGAADRVAFIDGDYHSTPFPDGNDVVLMSGMFHRETPDKCRRLIDKARGSLMRGGLLVVSDVFADAGGATPSFASLFGLNMMLTADDGTVHADTDVAQWLSDAGFGEVRRQPFPPPMPHRIVTGILQ
jgi:SAM-dependent methyltransferase